MKKLVILRGLPGSGKSTFINNHDLATYTISMDAIRLMFSSPIKNENGKTVVSQSYNSRVYEIFIEMFKERMSNGSFTVVDNTNMNNKSIKTLVEIAKENNFDICIVDFTSVPIDECISRDKNRKFYVGESVIRRMANYTNVSFENVTVFDHSDYISFKKWMVAE